MPEKERLFQVWVGCWVDCPRYRPERMVKTGVTRKEAEAFLILQTDGLHYVEFREIFEDE